MARKAHPNGFRNLIDRTWSSSWTTDNYNYNTLLVLDLKIKEYLSLIFQQKNIIIGDIEIFRTFNKIGISFKILTPLNQKQENILKDKKIIVLIKALQNIVKTPIIIFIDKSKILCSSADFIAEFVGNQILINKNNIKKGTIQSQKLLDKHFDKIKSKNLISGIKIVVYGKTQKKSRMKSKILIQIGQVPLQTLEAKIVYRSKIIDTKNGQYNIGIWLYFYSQNLNKTEMLLNFQKLIN
jgi:ribosomal protein S3